MFVRDYWLRVLLGTFLKFISNFYPKSGCLLRSVLPVDIILLLCTSMYCNLSCCAGPYSSLPYLYIVLCSVMVFCWKYSQLTTLYAYLSICKHHAQLTERLPGHGISYRPGKTNDRSVIGFTHFTEPGLFSKGCNLVGGNLVSWCGCSVAGAEQRWSKDAKGPT